MSVHNHSKISKNGGYVGASPKELCTPRSHLWISMPLCAANVTLQCNIKRIISSCRYWVFSLRINWTVCTCPLFYVFSGMFARVWQIAQKYGCNFTCSRNQPPKRGEYIVPAAYPEQKGVRNVRAHRAMPIHIERTGFDVSVRIVTNDLRSKISRFKRNMPAYESVLSGLKT